MICRKRVPDALFRWLGFPEKAIPITLTTTTGGSLVFGNPRAYAPETGRTTLAPAVLGQPAPVPRR